MKGKVAWVITCEHASNALPKKFTSLVPKTELQSHKGFDLGAKEYASLLAQELSGTFFCATYSRLLIDLNRSEGNPALFSQFTKTLSPSEKSRLLTTYYRPFRKRVEEFIRKKFSQGAFVIHLACHSFTPELHGNVRDMDVGILYDPKKVRERECGRVLRRELRKNSSMSIRCNAPYRGTSDGHTSALRLLFSQEKYIGIEIEVNQRLFSKNYNDLWSHLWLPLLVQACRALESSCH